MESLFLNIFKKELSFIDMRNAPDFNKENGDNLINKYKENVHVVNQTKVKKVLFKILAAVELILSVLISFALTGVCAFAFKKELYFLGIVLLIGGVILGIWSFVHLEEIITLKRSRRLLLANRLLESLEEENIVILKKVYLGLD